MVQKPDAQRPSDGRIDNGVDPDPDDRFRHEYSWMFSSTERDALEAQILEIKRQDDPS